MERQGNTSNRTGLGMRLRDARIVRGLSIDEVATSLKLSPKIIGALEEEAYDKLPSATYVRGYLRGYALLLGLEPQQLIDSFNNLPRASQQVDMTAPAPVREITSGDAMVKFGTLLVIGIVLGLAVLWWSGKDGGSSRRRPPAAAVSSLANEAPIRAAELQTEPTVADLQTKLPEPATAPAESPAPPVVVPRVEAQPVVATPAPSAPRARMTLRITEDSWADVRDAEQRRLLYETLAAGRVVTVEGVAPLNVFLGNVEGVVVEFNGQSYDTSRHKRGQVARFTLGSGAAN